jgi:broad-specificity NMP kinase
VLTVVFYGGPGVGKSTITAQIFAELKMRDVNVEQVNEVAKYLTWERRSVALSHQAYINAKQMFHMDRLRDQVDVIVTDTSPMLAMIYGRDLTQPFIDWIVDDYRRRNVVNILLRRDPMKPYQEAGRNQSYADALVADERIEAMLKEYGLPYTTLSVATPAAQVLLADYIEALL